MASAAAVGADATRSPLPYKEVDEVMGTTTTITSAEHAAQVIDRDSDDGAEDLGLSSKANGGHRTSNHGSEDRDMKDDNLDLDQADKDLFGSASEDEDADAPRKLDDSELDSGDDNGRNDRAASGDAIEEDEDRPLEGLLSMEADFGPHPVPESSDGELYLLKVPKFLGIEPAAFQPTTFQAPTTDLHSKKEASSTFSAYKTAMRTIRWRKSPEDPARLQSNARILRWSDGSLTLQMANDPTTQYLVPGQPLASPQHNPPKPTPTSTGGTKRKQTHGRKPGIYNSEQDAFTYLVSPSQTTGLLRITNKFTTRLQVEVNDVEANDAVSRLATRMNATKSGGPNGASGGIQMMEHTEDPELKKKRAEVTEKAMLKEARNRDLAEVRERDKANRTMGRRGLASSRYGGGGFDELEAGGGTRGAAGGRRAKPKRQRRGEIYSDDEDNWGARGRTKEDEYDQEDDFVATSDEDEEPEAVDEEDEDIDEGINLSRPTSRKGRSSPTAQTSDGQATGRASAPIDGSPVARAKRRRVIDEDDED